MTPSGGKLGKRPYILYGIEALPYTVKLRAALAPEVKQETGLA